MGALPASTTRPITQVRDVAYSSPTGPHTVILIADSSGELFLGVNDNYYPDNTGKWVATLSAVSAPTRSAVR